MARGDAPHAAASGGLVNLVHALNDTFLIRPVVIRRSAAAEEALAVEADTENEAQTTQGVFVDPKTLASFPIAASVVTTISQIVVRAMGGNMVIVALIVSLLIGALIVAITMSEPTARPRKLLEWVITIAIAVINSMLLYAAVVGVGQITGMGTQKS
jgi:hypothetical protein